jgi:hypothetical protein
VKGQQKNQAHENCQRQYPRIASAGEMGKRKRIKAKEKRKKRRKRTARKTPGKKQTHLQAPGGKKLKGNDAVNHLEAKEQRYWKKAI